MERKNRLFAVISILLIAWTGWEAYHGADLFNLIVGMTVAAGFAHSGGWESHRIGPPRPPSKYAFGRRDD